jgi:hypothetical protein
MLVTILHLLHIETLQRLQQHWLRKDEATIINLIIDAYSQLTRIGVAPSEDLVVLSQCNGVRIPQCYLSDRRYVDASWCWLVPAFLIMDHFLDA